MTLQNKIDLVTDSLSSSAYNSLDPHIYALDGLTSPRSQNLLNLISADFIVLEVGTFCGASTVAIANSAKHVITVDNWSNIEVESVDKKYITCINNPKEELKQNSKQYTNITMLEGDIFSETIFASLVVINFDIVFYDGPHTVVDIYTFLVLYENLFKSSILIIDDYNFDSVKEGINIGLEAITTKPSRTWLIETNGESLETFWNGIAIFIFE